MDNHPALLYKTLVVGVIVLIIGVGIQPVFADDVTNLEKENNESEIDFIPDLDVIWIVSYFFNEE